MKDRSVTAELTGEEMRLVTMLKALGNPIRFRMMQHLAESRVCITGDLVTFTGLAQSTVSQHLKVLREAGLIDGEVEGPATCYCVSADGLNFLKARIEQWLPDCCAPASDAGSAGSAGCN